MRRASILVAALALAGCATPYNQGGMGLMGVSKPR